MSEHSESEHKHAQVQRKKQSFIQGFIIGIIIVAVLFGVYSLGKQSDSGFAMKKTAGRSITTLSGGTLAQVSSDDHVRGSKKARVYLIEYSDLECPYCQKFHETAQQVVNEYDGEVAWIYRHFPLPSHAGAQKKAEAAECAGEFGGNDGFWNFVDAVFQAGPSLPESELATVAGRIGLDQSKFTECLSSGRHADAVIADYTSGQSAGVTGTPGNFVVNEAGEHQYIPGALPYAQVQSVIESLL